jgi:hypothetical protein
MTSRGFTFSIAPHEHRPDIRIVEVFLDGRFVAAIYPDDGIPALKVVSKHLDTAGAIIDPAFPPAILIPLATT